MPAPKALDPLNYGFCGLLDVDHLNSSTELCYFQAHEDLVLSHMLLSSLYLDDKDPRFIFYI